jgi:hypothetical protein
MVETAILACGPRSIISHDERQSSSTVHQSIHSVWSFGRLVPSRFSCGVPVKVELSTVNDDQKKTILDIVRTDVGQRKTEPLTSVGLCNTTPLEQSLLRTASSRYLFARARAPVYHLAGTFRRSGFAELVVVPPVSYGAQQQNHFLSGGQWVAPRWVIVGGRWSVNLLS